MEKNIVLIHAGIGVLLVLYLLLRILISLFGLFNKEYQQAIRSKFRISDWIFGGFLAITGLYPILVLGEIELYHIIKIVLLAAVLWLSRYAHSLNFALASLLCFGLVLYSGYASFTDTPTFPKEQGTFARDYPEISELGELKKGEFIFTTLCAQCHGNNGKKGLFGAADLTVSELNLDAKIKMIKDGSPLTVMRSFKNELSEDEINAVAKYVNQLK